MRTPIRSASGTWPASGSSSTVFGATVAMMPVGAEVRRRSGVADFSRQFSDLVLTGAGREIRTAGGREVSGR